MIEDLLIRDEGKTLEFKENVKSLSKVIQTIIAFTNTAGGKILIGVRDGTKEIVGVENILKEEERIANAIADLIEPFVTPSIQMFTFKGRDLLLITVSHGVGPYYLKSKGMVNGTFIRLGSTNRLADCKTIDEIQLLRKNLHFDELPCFEANLESLDFTLASSVFEKVSKQFTKNTAKSLGVLVTNQEKICPSNGGLLLFGKNRKDFFPDAIIQCGRFKGLTKSKIIDQLNIEEPLPLAAEAILSFIRRNTSLQAEFGDVRRRDIPEYPPLVVREAIINALLHTDYSIKGASIHVAIFDDRLEVTNPGCLPYGVSMNNALSGVSQLRNHIIGRVFRELDQIERWGSGMKRMIEGCEDHGITPPKFEELGTFFRVTLYNDTKKIPIKTPWQEIMVNYLKEKKEITPKEARKIWNVSDRSSSIRLQKMCKMGILAELSTGKHDPKKTFILRVESVF